MKKGRFTLGVYSLAALFLTSQMFVQSSVAIAQVEASAAYCGVEDVSERDAKTSHIFLSAPNGVAYLNTKTQLERDLDRLQRACEQSVSEKVDETVRERQAELARVGINCTIQIGPITLQSLNTVTVSKSPLFNISDDEASWLQNDGDAELDKMQKKVSQWNLKKTDTLLLQFGSLCSAKAEVTLCCDGDKQFIETETSSMTYSANY